MNKDNPEEAARFLESRFAENVEIQKKFSNEAFDWVTSQGYATCTSDIQIALMEAFDAGFLCSRRKLSES